VLRWLAQLNRRLLFFATVLDRVVHQGFRAQLSIASAGDPFSNAGSGARRDRARRDLFTWACASLFPFWRLLLMNGNAWIGRPHQLEIALGGARPRR